MVEQSLSDNKASSQSRVDVDAVVEEMSVSRAADGKMRRILCSLKHVSSENTEEDQEKNNLKNLKSGENVLAW